MRNFSLIFYALKIFLDGNSAIKYLLTEIHFVILN